MDVGKVELWPMRLCQCNASLVLQNRVARAGRISEQIIPPLSDRTPDFEDGRRPFRPDFLKPLIRELAEDSAGRPVIGSISPRALMSGEVDPNVSMVPFM